MGANEPGAGTEAEEVMFPADSSSSANDVPPLSATESSPSPSSSHNLYNHSRRLGWTDDSLEMAAPPSISTREVDAEMDTSPDLAQVSSEDQHLPAGPFCEESTVEPAQLQDEKAGENELKATPAGGMDHMDQPAEVADSVMSDEGSVASNDVTISDV